MEELNLFLKNSYWATYIFILFIGAFSGSMYVMRTIGKEQLDTKKKKIKYVVYGMGSSMLFTWITYEIGVYFGLPYSLSVAVGGGVGFLGAEVVTNLILNFVKKKLDD